jgi:hypothetical protein
LVARTKGSVSGAREKGGDDGAGGQQGAPIRVCCRFAADDSKQQQNRRTGAGTLYAVAVSTSISPSPLASTALARSRSRSFSQAAMTTVATQLPMRLPTARALMDYTAGPE